MVPVCAGKIFIVHKYCKSIILNQACQKSAKFTSLSLSLFDDITSLTYFVLLMNLEPIISSVNRDLRFDRVNFIMESLGVSVHV